MSMLNLSAAEWAFFAPELEPGPYYERLKAMGLSGIEMVEEDRREAARNAGLERINLIGPGMQEGLNKLENHGDLLPQLRNAIAAAKNAAIPHVIVFSGNADGLSTDEGIRNCAEGLKQLAADARDAGVTLVLEMFNEYDHPGYHAVSSAYGFEVARRVASPAVKVLYDVYHMVRMGEDPATDIVENLDLVAHLHVAESPERTVPVEGGAIDYRSLVKEVQAAGYNGYWGFEFIVKTRPLDELEQAAALFHSFV